MADGLEREAGLSETDTTRSPHTRLVGLLRLSRWKEHILFTIPLTLLGINMAVDYGSSPEHLNWHVLTVTAANILAVAFAFMVNDVEDAPDDALETERAARNPVTCGEISRREGWLASLVVGALALVLFAWVSPGAFWVGAWTVVLGLLYSWRVVRLKARPLIDLVSHVLMLSALLFLAGYFAYDQAPGGAWLVALGAALASAYGQLYNQLRDYDMDRAAGLHNTASILGRLNTQRMMYASIVLAGACLAITVVMGLWPLWLAIVPVIMAPLFFLFRPRTDMRGTEAIDMSGRIQWSFMIVANVAVLVWMVAILMN
jgi:4-hydroxybenzoate polyprenyltransferase